MNILLFGATGGTGRQVIAQGLEKGYRIGAFVRNPNALVITNPKLSVVKGNISEVSQIEGAMKSQDVVISTLGVKTHNALFRQNTIISDGLKNIIAAMKKKGIKRILFIASFGVNNNIFLPEKLFIRIILRNIFADIPRQEDLLKKSGLEWTIVHPARLTNGPFTGSYYKGENLWIGPFSHISRSDVADFLLKNISSEEFLRKTVTISY